MHGWCTKTHMIRGIYYYTALGTRVRLEARFVVIGYGQECELP
jgi:hypothetical protein